MPESTQNAAANSTRGSSPSTCPRVPNPAISEGPGRWSKATCRSLLTSPAHRKYPCKRRIDLTVELEPPDAVRGLVDEPEPQAIGKAPRESGSRSRNECGVDR